MKFRHLLCASFVIAFSGLPVSVSSMEVNVGNIRVQTDRDGELFVNTPRGRIYIPPEDDYYEDGDYYEGDYDYYEDDYYEDDYYGDYCSDGRTVVQRQVLQSGSSRQEVYSSVSSRDC